MRRLTPDILFLYIYLKTTHLQYITFVLPSYPAYLCLKLPVILFRTGILITARLSFEQHDVTLLFYYIKTLLCLVRSEKPAYLHGLQSFTLQCTCVHIQKMSVLSSLQTLIVGKSILHIKSIIHKK